METIDHSDIDKFVSYTVNRCNIYNELLKVVFSAKLLKL